MHTSKLCSDVKREKAWKPLKCDRGPIFQVTNEQKLTPMRHSEIQYQPSPTARNGSLEMLQTEISRVFDRLENQF